MCLSLKPTAAVWADTSCASVPASMGPDVSVDSPIAQGSLRTKLWDLPPSAQCPVVGVCLSMARLQVLLKKAGHHIQGLSAYEQHQLAVGDTRRHSRLADIVQRELDRDYALTLHSLKAVRDEQGLHDRWREASAASHWAGVFWGVITHPRCTQRLLDTVLGDVHMLQHQVGVASRLDQQQALRLQRDHDELRQQLKTLQQRLQEQQEQASLKEQAWRKQLLEERQRAAQAASEAERARRTLDEWERAHTNTLSLGELQADNQSLRASVSLLERSLRRAGGQVSADTDNTPARTSDESAGSACAQQRSWQWLSAPAQPLPSARCVVCVGGSAAQTHQYADVAESTGVNLVHHDGGIDHKITRLDQCLSQADVVICQTGCISHNAYWRVKEHCKRTGTPCAFVGNASPNTLRQVLQALASDGSAQNTPVVVP